MRSRWTPLSRFPLTKAIHGHLMKSNGKGYKHRTDIVSEKLCDQILQRLSPFLRNSSPIDILDLWPGPGFWSSKVNDFLQPRRHLLVEPQAVQKYYGKFTEDLAKSKSCYEILSIDPLVDHNWPELFQRHLPEQGLSSGGNTTGKLTKNDTLLVLASPFLLGSKRDHYTSARWWARFMKACAQQTEFHTYGSVRLLAFLPAPESEIILPRSVQNRRGPALLTEAVASHAFEVASTYDIGEWVTMKQWDIIEADAARVAERTAERSVDIPRGRQLPPIPMAPKSPDPGRKGVPYAPRAMYGRVVQLIDTIEAPKDPKADGETTRAAESNRKRAISYLNSENQRIYMSTEVANKQAEADELTKSLSRAAADPNADPEKLKALDEKIASVKSDFRTGLSKLEYKALSKVQLFIDGRRAALHSGSFDDAVLVHERRPFEPLRIDPDELYPRGQPISMIYFEAGLNSPVARRLEEFDPSERANLVNYVDIILPCMVNRGDRTVSELLELLFPTRPINDMVKSIPSLAKFASKKLKPGFENLPKIIHPDPEDVAAGREPDPAASFQENLDYDLGDVRVRCLPVATLLGILFEYKKMPASLPDLQLARLLGGSVTSAIATGGMSTTRMK